MQDDIFVTFWLIVTQNKHLRMACNSAVYGTANSIGTDGIPLNLASCSGAVLFASSNFIKSEMKI